LPGKSWENILNNKMDKEKEKKYWLAFNVFEGIGPLRFRLLLKYFGTAEKAYQAKISELIKIGLSPKIVFKFDRFRNNFNIDSYFLRVCNLGVSVLTSENKIYPKLLKEIQDYPSILYVKTKNLSQIFSQNAVAVVGTRQATVYGQKTTAMIVKSLISHQYVIVSGLARGIDKVAHETAIQNHGLTIGVLGSGLDIIYPPEHKELMEKIIERDGAVISEFPLGTKPLRGNFPARNRIISGLSLGVVVAEAAQRSGSMISASWAAEQGREVFAIPGPITSPMSKGTAELIKKGAKLVTGIEDILEELKIRE